MENKELLQAFFEDVSEVMEEWVRLSLALNPAEGAAGLAALLRCAHNLKGSSGLVGLTKFRSAVRRIEDHLLRVRDLGLDPDEKLVALLLETERVFHRWVSELKNNRAHVEDLSLLEGSWQEYLSVKPVAEEMGLQVRPERSAKRNRVAEAESLRVAVSKLDRVIQLAGEITLHHGIIERASREGKLQTTSIRAVIDLNSKLTQDLQDAALSLRMIPVANLFQRVERIAREAASKLNKNVVFESFGGDVTLDKLVVEGVVDALVHIARNAVDHGIEPQEDRVLANKPPAGLITIRAENTASGVTITFEDDGRGIDPDKVYAKALNLGLVNSEMELSPQAKLQLIFMAGLSTAETLTEFSGRGVGMDVVADSVRRMGGRLELQSDLGRGTRILITLPTNLSLVDALVVRVGGTQYAVPNTDLTEIIDLRDFNNQSVNAGVRQVIDLRGKVVPVTDMRQFLRLQDSVKPVSPSEDPCPGLVVRHMEDWLALAVESVVGQQQVFVRPLSGHLSPVTFYSGSTILSDGEPTIILNLPEMARQYFTNH